MRILWIRRLKKDKAEESEKNAMEKQPFPDHDEDMKKFRQLHQELQTAINKDIFTTDSGILAPVHGVRLAKNSQN